MAKNAEKLCKIVRKFFRIFPLFSRNFLQFFCLFTVIMTVIKCEKMTKNVQKFAYLDIVGSIHLA